MRIVAARISNSHKRLPVARPVFEHAATLKRKPQIINAECLTRPREYRPGPFIQSLPQRNRFLHPVHALLLGRLGGIRIVAARIADAGVALAGWDKSPQGRMVAQVFF